MLDSLTCGALFAGIGGFCYGFERQGFKTVWASEIDERAASTYKHNFEHVDVFSGDSGDIRALSAEISQLPPVDVLHAGFPCQSFSVAGNRKGFKDPRGRLFFEIPRLLLEWGDRRPKIVVLENSPNILTGDRGHWFDEVRTQLQAAGYWFGLQNCFEIDTFEWTNLPQKRSRLFMIAVSREFSKSNSVVISKPRVKKKAMTSLLSKSKKIDEKYFLDPENRYAKLIGKQLDLSTPTRLYQLRKYQVRKQEVNVCPTLTANMGAGGHNVPFLWDSGCIRKLTERECLNLQGFPKGFEFPPEIPQGAKYSMIGNAVSPLISEIIAKELMTTLLTGKAK
jgi:DNA (cytosine-5)-methyltransferase 1